MSKFKVVNLFDKLFVTVAIFLIAFAWINFYIRSLYTTFFLSLVLTFACVFVLYYFLNKKQTKKVASAKKQSEINKNFYVFKLTPQTERLKLLKQVLSKKFETELKHGILTYTIAGKLHLVIIATKYEILKQNDLLNLLDEFLTVKTDTIDIICNQVQGLNLNIFTDKSIKIVDKNELYKMFEQAQIFPDSANINTAETKIKFKDIISSMFIPQKARSYFLCGLVLIFSSIILPYNTYYIIVGSMLLLFSLICKLLPRFK